MDSDINTFQGHELMAVQRFVSVITPYRTKCGAWSSYAKARRISYVRTCRNGNKGY